MFCALVDVDVLIDSGLLTRTQSHICDIYISSIYIYSSVVQNTNSFPIYLV